MGAILVNINPAYRSHELEYALRQSGVTLLITAPGFRQHGYRATLAGLVPELAASPDSMPPRSAALPDLRGIVCLGDEPGPGMMAWRDVLSRAEDAAASPSKDPALRPVRRRLSHDRDRQGAKV